MKAWWTISSGALAGAMGCAAPSPAATDAVVLPARFEADRIFVDLPVTGGDTLHLYTDTGGGLFLFATAAERIRWTDTTGVALSRLAADSTFPEPLGNPDRRLPIFRSDQAAAAGFDGMLGQAWFADRVWTVDYPARRFLLHRSAAPVSPDARSAPLGFKADSSGARALSFPRITAVVDGDTLEWLFDTGAMAHLPPAALAEVADSGPPLRATSFVTSSVLARWRERHPDWRVIANADVNVPGMSMILVPEVTVAGVTAGPVWFTERPDKNFHEYMSQWMDRRVDGALGGSLWRYFRVTLDYPGARAHLVRVDR
jgi:hypothetical protein